LSQWSWEKNDVLTLFTPNCIDTPAVTWGCHWAGGIVSLANPGNNSIGLSQHLKHSGSKALITQNSCLPTALKAAAEVGLPRSRILLIEDTKNQTGQVRHFTSLLDPSECHRPQLMIRPEVDLAYLVYTSGTTGLAKGAMVTHSNVVAHLVMANTVDGKMLEPGIDKVLAVLPYYHIYGKYSPGFKCKLFCSPNQYSNQPPGLMFLVHLPLYIGVESVTMAEFEIAKFCSVIQRHKITYTYVAPPIVLHLAKNPIIDSYDLSSLRMMVSGAAPLSKELIIAIYKRLSIPVRQAYGLSETTSATHLQVSLYLIQTLLI
jgi:4-coumarate--CoA ligase